ncbi:MAG: DUF262 domain-containing protein [Flavobacteriaceae bacterium]|nr:DUF262 domain-containing protein [Flavobacteriaceae bacterium]
MGDFNIKASVYTLTNIKKDSYNYFNPNKHYTIPVYQRPYSWTEEHLKKLIKNIFVNCKESHNFEELSPFFLGTIQLAPNNDGYDVIDGQQRLTTLLILLKILNKEYSLNNENNFSLSLNT